MTERSLPPNVANSSPSMNSKEMVEEEFPIGPDGKPDYLKVDPPIHGQNWVCMSFVSPEQMIKKRDIYFFNKFLYTEVNKTLKDQSIHMAKEVNNLLREAFEKKIEKLGKSVNETDNLVSRHLKEAYKKTQFDEEEFANKCMHLYRIDYSEIHDRYSMFCTQNEAELGKKFDEENEYQVSIRGFKVRGIFNDRKEADEKAKELRETMEPVHVYVAPVGYWCPWDPDPDAVQDSDYMVPALNELMGKYHENVKQKNQFFKERKQELMQDANMTNRERMKQRLRQKLIKDRQAKMESELRQKKLEEEINQISDEDKVRIMEQLIKEDESRKAKKAKQNKKKGKK